MIFSKSEQSFAARSYTVSYQFIEAEFIGKYNNLGVYKDLKLI